MILGTPITWLMADIVAVVLFVVCIIHASRQENATIKILELLGFLIFSGIFENIGVASGRYDYDLHRIMLVGKVPLQILVLEGVIFYVALRLAEYLHIPAWGKPFVVGFLCSVQDMTLDPSAIYDQHLFNGVMSGQWNWAPYYDGTFFGIPFFNFSGWIYMMACYVIGSQVVIWLYKKTKTEALVYLYPFLAVFLSLVVLVSPTSFLVTGAPIFPPHTRNAELGLLVFNLLLGLLILLRYQKIDRPFDFKKDAPVFFIPVALHLYDIVIAFALNLQLAYVPVLLFSALHIGYLVYVYAQGKRVENSVKREIPVVGSV